MINDWITGGILTIVLAEIFWLSIVHYMGSRIWCHNLETSTKYFMKFFCIMVGGWISIGLIHAGLYQSLAVISIVYLVGLFIYLNVKLADWLYFAKKSKGRYKR
jgi:hypothetical protein